MSLFTEPDFEQVLKNTAGLSGAASRGGRLPNPKIVGDVVVPSGIHIKVESGSLKGTIGRLIDLDYRSFCRGPYSEKHLSIMSVKYVIEIDGRPNPVKIAPKFTKAMDDYEGPTKWVRTVKLKSEEEKKIPIPVNKFGQELKKGSWVIGVGKGSVLKFGLISRWTKHNIWAVPFGCELGDKNREFIMDSMKQTFLLPEDALIDELTLATLRGYSGQ